MKRVLAMLAAALVVLSAWSESLAPPDFKGYLSGAKPLAKGDAIVVEIDASSKLAFSASSADDKLFIIEFSGGETGNLFSFLPQGRTGGTRTSQGKQELSLKATLAASVTEVDATGRAFVQGSRTTTIEGKQESVTVSGWVNSRDVSSERHVTFSRLGDARLVYRTFLGTGQDVLTAADIQEVLSAQAAPTASATPSTGTEAASTAQPAAAQPAAGTTTATTAAAAQPTKTLSITDAKKRELLLAYLNRLVDLVFGQ